MLKFVAHVAVNTTSLTELGFFPEPQIGSFFITDEGPDGFVASSGAVRVEVSGHDISYLFGGPGTIDTIKVFHSGDLAYKIVAGNGIPSAELINSGLSNLAEVAAIIFDGNNKFKGSDGDDFFVGGGGNDKFVGKDGDDTLVGNDGKDNFDGGRGDDTYDGGSGKDVYVFKDAPDSGVDTILKYQSGEHIKLDGHDFKHLGSKGRLDADFFVAGTKAKDGDDHIIYDKATGHLLYDDDGKGGDHAVLFAVLANHPGHLDSDLIIVI